jgi:carboxyl-terminal processing protease
MVIDKNTASSSEVFVLALKEHLNVKLVGQTTYGKGKAQTTKVFSDGSALKYTDFLWYSDNKVSVADVGIAPDTEVLLDDALYLSYLQLSDGVELAYDSVNTLTGQAQIMLNFLNDHVNDLREDGYFDRQTEKALMKFQSDNGISPASGKLDQKTAAALNAQVVMKWNEHQDKYDTQMMEAEKEILR